MTHAFNSGCACCLPTNALSRTAVPLHRRSGCCGSAARRRRRGGEAQAATKPTQAGRPILIKGGCVLSLDKAVGDFEQADVLIEGKKIVAVKPNISAPNAQVIDASKRIVMPGFVDTHVICGRASCATCCGRIAGDYRNVVQAHLRRQDDADDVYAADYISALGAIDAGVTCILDWSHIQIRPRTAMPVSRDCRTQGTGDFRLWRGPERERPGHGDCNRQISRRHRAAAQTVFLQRRSTRHALSRSTWRHAGSDPFAVQGRARRGRPHHHPCRGRRVRAQRAAGKAQCEKGLKDDTTYIHCCTLNDTEWKLIKDTGGTISIAGYVET